MINLVREKNPMPEQDPNVRNKNFLEVAEGYTEEMAVNEAMRCLKCRKKPCMSGCPVMVKIPDFIAKIAEGEFEEAYQIISETSSLPAICGRVCPQETQCEGKCVHGIKGEPVAIGRLGAVCRRLARGKLRRSERSNRRKATGIGLPLSVRALQALPAPEI